MSSLVLAVGTLFAPAATTAVAATIGSAVTGAVVGGVISKATGGSFGKGALFGAIGGAALGGLGGLGSGAAAGSAAGTAAGAAAGTASGGLFSGGLGSVLGQGLAQGAQAWLGAREAQEQRNAIEDQEQRRVDRFSGAGAAMNPFRDEDGNFERVGLGGGFATQAATGGPAAVDERAVDRGVMSAGDEYQRKVSIASERKTRQRARYNPQTGRIEYQEG